MAYIYNVTIQVDRHIATDWLQWMQQEHIPAVMQTGHFSSYRMLRLLDIDNSEGPTYAVQYMASDIKDYKRYEADHAPALLQAAFDRWGSGFISFPTLMEIVL